MVGIVHSAQPQVVPGVGLPQARFGIGSCSPTNCQGHKLVPTRAWTAGTLGLMSGRFHTCRSSMKFPRWLWLCCWHAGRGLPPWVLSQTNPSANIHPGPARGLAREKPFAWRGGGILPLSILLAWRLMVSDPSLCLVFLVMSPACRHTSSWAARQGPDRQISSL